MLAARRAQNSFEIEKTAAAPVLPTLSAIGLVWNPKIGSVTRNMRPVAEKTQSIDGKVYIRTVEPGAVRNAVGIRSGAFSGNMKVSFQAARSIG